MAHNNNTHVQNIQEDIPRVLEDDLELHKQGQLGFGGFAYVWRASLQRTGENVAVKRLKIDAEAEVKSEFLNEAEHMRRVTHRHILSLIALLVNRNGRVIGLVLPYLQYGSMRMYMETIKTTKEDRVDKVEWWILKFTWAYGIALGMAYLHSLRPMILHLDLKPDNVLISNDLEVKVSDFGLARSKMKYHQISEESTSEAVGGTSKYIPPEYIHNRKTRVSTKFDVYSYAITLYCILAEEHAYKDVDGNIGEHVKSGKRPDPALIPQLKDPSLSCASELLKDLAIRCWQTDSQCRPEFDEITTYCAVILTKFTGDPNWVSQNPQDYDRVQRALYTPDEYTVGSLDSSQASGDISTDVKEISKQLGHLSLGATSPEPPQFVKIRLWKTSPTGRGLRALWRKPREVGTYSVGKEWNFCPNNSQLRYFRPPRNWNNVRFDLDYGFGVSATREDNAGIIEKTNMDHLLTWIQMNKDRVAITPGSMPEFVCRRKILANILKSPYTTVQFGEPWEIIVTRHQGTYYLSSLESHEMDDASAEQHLHVYRGKKFEHYITSDKPDGVPNRSAPVQALAGFVSIVRTTFGDSSLLIAANGNFREVGDDTENYVMAKTNKILYNDRMKKGFIRNKLFWSWCQSVLSGCSKVVVGFRTDEGIVTHIRQYLTKDIPQICRDIPYPRDTDVCLDYLDRFLHIVKTTVTEDDPKMAYLFRHESGSDKIEYRRAPELCFLPQWYLESNSGARRN